MTPRFWRSSVRKVPFPEKTNLKGKKQIWEGRWCVLGTLGFNYGIILGPRTMKLEGLKPSSSPVFRWDSKFQIDWKANEYFDLILFGKTWFCASKKQAPGRIYSKILESSVFYKQSVWFYFSPSRYVVKSFDEISVN